MQRFATLMAEGKLRAVIEKTYTFDESLEAIERLKRCKLMHLNRYIDA